MKIVFLQIRWTENCYYYYYFPFLEFLIDKQKEKGNRLLRIFLIFVFFLYNSDLSRKKLSSFGKVIETIFTISMERLDWERSSQPEPPAGDTGERSALSELCNSEERDREGSNRQSVAYTRPRISSSFIFFFLFSFSPPRPFHSSFFISSPRPKRGGIEKRREEERREHTYVQLSLEITLGDPSRPIFIPYPPPSSHLPFRLRFLATRWRHVSS